MAFRKYFKFFTLDLKLSNYRVTILGEVGSPGTQYVYNIGTNLLEAIANSGGFTEHSNRQKVNIIRQVDGKLVEKKLNLQDKSILNSPYFYPLPGDVYFVEPRSSKLISLNLQTLAFITSIISLFTIALTFSQNN